QPFTSLITFGVNTAGLQDKKAAMIGNVYLFPLGTTAPDMNIEVFYEGERVEGAEVLLQPETGSNVLTTDSSSVISPTLGYQKALSVTTDADGIATLAGTSLVLGGRYKVQVLPTTYKGIQLGLENNATTVTVGTSTIRQRVDMAHILPANNNGLYVVSASNENFDGINSSGILTIQLNRPVSIVNESLVSASLTNETTAALDTNSPGSDVTATVSTDGLTITLTPNFATNPVAFSGNNSGTADNGLTVTFANLFIRLQ